MTKLFFENRNFRSLTLFTTFGGIGRGMFSIFMMWMVHALFQNPIYTGIAGFMFGAPFVISFMVGPLVDRWNKVKVLRAVEFTKFCTVGLILAADIFYYTAPWILFVAIFVFSIATLFGSPATTALLPKIVAGEDLVKANALMNIVGIAAGLGLMVVLFVIMRGGAESTEFTIIYITNAAILLIAALSSIFLRSNESKEPGEAASYFSELKDGFRFAKKGVMFPLISATVAMGFFANVAYVNFPAFAELHLGAASGYILLSALALTGGIVGSYLSRAVDSRFKLGQIFVIVLVLAGISRILFVNVIPVNLTQGILIYVLYVGLGSAYGIFENVLIQKLPPKDLISRVVTTRTSINAVAVAIGSLVGGVLGTMLDIDTIFFIQGGSYIAIGVLLFLSKQVRELPKVSELKTSEEPI